ncbi:hypothetical protein [Leptospira borgpetersenii]|uniref:hypothetical protein n=1 Tax=Leptospira borgpetersenii TaxID=174 RepID=UPI00187ED746|nr:hypothetical protein [Leptospira borgpetersenii]MBE8364467.1 hypothetical protein [Leptospira borgpetersenii serovar Balcanica]MBE8366400.1 hypothetical protein [Leptospira borgpetersenii serovar Balcanica]MBE8422997.1 hypothetical protein [Leptospira borgpetersenii serovar Balcanica]MBF3350110.1 hypothetical protein [Leptospira borgpetersenii serovar Balcanica]
MSFLKLPMTKPGLVTLVKVVCSMSRFLVALRRELRGNYLSNKIVLESKFDGSGLV